jgi:hypothetical protein
MPTTFEFPEENNYNTNREFLTNCFDGYDGVRGIESINTSPIENLVSKIVELKSQNPTFNIPNLDNLF